MYRDLSKFKPPKSEPDGLTKKLFGYKCPSKASKRRSHMGFKMKNRYETGEEFYQDLKNHLIEDGFVTIKTDNETLAILSEDEDEWYCHYWTCTVCNTDFMCHKPKFCPSCGRKIIGSKHGNETVFYGKGDINEQKQNN